MLEVNETNNMYHNAFYVEVYRKKNVQLTWKNTQSEHNCIILKPSLSLVWVESLIVAVDIEIKNFFVVPSKILCFHCQALFTSLTLFLQIIDFFNLLTLAQTEICCKVCHAVSIVLNSN
jgi:hypothetical protein